MRRHTPSSNERCKWNLEPVCAVSATPASVGSGCGGTNWREKKKHTAPNNTLTNECFYGATSAMRWPQQRRPCGAAPAALQVLRQKRHPYHGSCNARRALPPRGAYRPWFCACGGWLCGGRSPGSASDSSVRSIAPAPANAPRARARVYTGTSLVLRCTVDASTARAKRAVPRRALRCDADMLPTRVHACLDGSITSHMRLCDRCFCHKNNLHVQAGIADSLTPSSLFASIYVQKWLQASKQQSHDEHT